MVEGRLGLVSGLEIVIKVRKVSRVIGMRRVCRFETTPQIRLCRLQDIVVDLVSV